MFEVGRLVARIALEGAQTVGRDLKQVGSEFAKLDEDARQGLTSVGVGLTTVGGSILALAGVAVAKFAEFDSAMSAVRATVQGSAADNEALKQSAIDAGAASVFSATEAADAQNELAKAGVRTKDILGGGLTGSLALAAAGQIGVAEAAETAATAMTQFNLSGEQIPHLADLLAAGAGKAQGGVSDLSAALGQSGLVASQFGLSVEETIGTLSAFASAGLLGSDAGTSFKSMLLALANPSKEAANLMKQYNIQAYDAQGNFVGITNLAGQLQVGFEGASAAQRDQALATIFGTDAIRSANVLYSQGAAGIKDWTDAVDDSGYAAEQAAELQNNLAGDVEKLGGAFDSVLIRAGEGSNGMLRTMIQLLTSVVDAYGSAPPAIQQVVGVLGLVGGAGLVAVGGLVLAGAKVVELRLQLGALAAQAPTAVARLRSIGTVAGGALTAGLAVAALALASFAINQAEIAATANEFRDSLDQSTGAVTDNTRALLAQKLASSGAYEAAKEAGISQKELTDAVMEGGGALDEVSAKLRNNNTFLTFFSGVGIRAGNANAAIQDLSTALDRSQSDFGDVAAATDDSTDSTQANEEALAALAGQASDASTEVSDLADAIRDFSSGTLDAREAQRQLEAAVDGVEENLQAQRDAYEEAHGSLEGFTASLDISTDAGRENQSALDDIAQSALDYAGSVLEAGGSTDEAKEAIKRGREELIKALGQFGITGQAAEDYADELGLIPDNVNTAVGVTGLPAAKEAINGFIRGFDGRVIRLKVAASGNQSYSYDGGNTFAEADGGVVSYYASGGINEHHVAQIAAAGSTRVWNEPETGGEAYIPMALSKRERSLAVLGEVMSRFGVSGGSKEFHIHGQAGMTLAQMIPVIRQVIREELGS